MKIDSKFKPVETMTLKDAFNNHNSYEFYMLGEAALRVRLRSGGTEYRYDFGLRLLTVQYGEAVSTHPFSALDRETLIELRDKLVELGGKPPELPQNENPAPQTKRGLNL